MDEISLCFLTNHIQDKFPCHENLDPPGTMLPEPFKSQHLAQTGPHGPEPVLSLPSRPDPQEVSPLSVQALVLAPKGPAYLALILGSELSLIYLCVPITKEIKA